MPDTMEHDPLNEITNTFSKVEEWETASYQVICHPVSNSKWQKKAEQEANNFFTKKPSRRKIFT